MPRIEVHVSLTVFCRPCSTQDDLRGRSLTDSGERPYVLSKSYVLMANTRELARRCEGSAVDIIAGQDRQQHQLQCVQKSVHDG